MPELAIVPSAETRSARDMPTPLSTIGQNALVLIDLDPDRKRRFFRRQGRIGNRLVAQLFAGVRRIGNQFAQENVAVGIDRMHHEMQKARDIGLKGVVAGLSCAASVAVTAKSP